MRDPKTPATGHEHCRFLIPIISLPDDSGDELNPVNLPRICRSSVQLLLGIGDEWWRTCDTCVRNNTVPDPLYFGNINAQLKDSAMVNDDLHIYFQDILSMCDVIPTRFV
jgi:hypothetical protein